MFFAHLKQFFCGNRKRHILNINIPNTIKTGNRSLSARKFLLTLIYPRNMKRFFTVLFNRKSHAQPRNPLYDFINRAESRVQTHLHIRKSVIGYAKPRRNRNFFKQLHGSDIKRIQRKQIIVFLDFHARDRPAIFPLFDIEARLKQKRTKRVVKIFTSKPKIRLTRNSIIRRNRKPRIQRKGIQDFVNVTVSKFIRFTSKNRKP